MARLLAGRRLPTGDGPINPSPLPVEVVTTVDENGQHSKVTALYGRLNNQTHEFTDPDEKDAYQRWG